MPSVKEPRARGKSLEELGLSPLNEAQVNALKGNMEKWLFDEMGIALENGRVPNSNLVIPRIYVLGTDEKGEDKPLRLSELNIKPGDKEFFEQVRMGNVFAYPAGQADPVQLQIETNQTTNLPEMSYSKPIAPEQTPMQEVPRLSRWEGFWNRVSFGGLYRQRRQARERYKRNRASMTASLQKNKEGRAGILTLEKRLLEEEKARRLRVKQALEKQKLQAQKQKEEEEKKKLQAQKQKEEEEKKKLQAQKQKKQEDKKEDKKVPQPQRPKKALPVRDPLEEDLKQAEDDMFAAERGREQFISVFKPVPKKTERLLARQPNHPKGKREHFYDEEHFRDLTFLTNDKDAVLKRLKAQDAELEKKYEQHPDVDANNKAYKFRPFDQKGIKIGGKSVTDAQFAALSLASCWSVKHAMECAKHDSSYNPTLDETLKRKGWTKAERDLCLTEDSRSFATTDFFMKMRDKEGDAFSYYVDPARLDAAEALEQYKDAKPEALAELIAVGVTQIAHEIRNIFSPDKLPEQPRGAFLMGAELVGLLEQDPKLKQLAMDKGMKSESLTSLQGQIKIVRMEQDARNAQYTLAAARAEKRELSKETKRVCAEKLLRGKIALLELHKSRKAYEDMPNTEYSKVFMGEVIPVPDPKGPKENWPVPPEGQIYVSSYQHYISGVIHREMPIPKLPSELMDQNKAAKFEACVQQIIDQEHLADKSVDELYQDLNLLGRKKNTLDLSACLKNAKEAVEQKRHVQPIQAHI